MVNSKTYVTSRYSTPQAEYIVKELNHHVKKYYSKYSSGITFQIISNKYIVGPEFDDDDINRIYCVISDEDILVYLRLKHTHLSTFIKLVYREVFEEDIRERYMYGS